MSAITTAVPSITWLPTGLSLPLESNILAGVMADLSTSLGGNMSQSLSSPQGQWAQTLTGIIGYKNNDIAYIASQVDPDNAEGRMQDAIGRIYFIQRIPGSGTVVQCNCVGLVNTVIPQGSLVQDANGNIYASTIAATIPASGNINVTFQCLVDGPIICPPNVITIYKQVNGWESANNPSGGTPGDLVESRAAFEARRSNSVAVNAVNSLQAIWAAVLSVPNVIGCYVVDNSTNAAVTVGSTNYSVAANSVLVSAYGGSASAIAQAIWSKKSLGCVYNGNTTETVTDTTNPEGPPYPTYSVTFLIPTATPVYFACTLAANPNLPSNINTLVQNAILAVAEGTSPNSTLPAAQQNTTINAGAYYAAIYAISPYVNITSLTVGLTASPTGTSIQMGVDQMPTFSASNIAVTT